MVEATLPKVKSLLATPEPADLGPAPHAGASSQTQINVALDRLLGDSGLTAERRDLVRALVLLWHDHLEAAHELAQSVEDRDGSFVHAIMHRREPDYANAKYWFRRAGSHPGYPAIADRVAALLDTSGEPELRQRLISRGQWDPFAFVDACEEASRQPAGDKQYRLLREVQRIEFETLLEYLLGAE